mmetsp:Transcript_32712/g.82506  ORF Transcript_32712/g.82506 Transcript_32712/m.82506 type:complete len:283 (-) Transcript_32712:567-1415(-)
MGPPQAPHPLPPHVPRHAPDRHILPHIRRLPPNAHGQSQTRSSWLHHLRAPVLPLCPPRPHLCRSLSRWRRSDVLRVWGALHAPLQGWLGTAQALHCRPQTLHGGPSHPHHRRFGLHSRPHPPQRHDRVVLELCRHDHRHPLAQVLDQHKHPCHGPLRALHPADIHIPHRLRRGQRVRHCKEDHQPLQARQRPSEPPRPLEILPPLPLPPPLEALGDRDAGRQQGGAANAHHARHLRHQGQQRAVHIQQQCGEAHLEGHALVQQPLPLPHRLRGGFRDARPA